MHDIREESEKLHKDYFPVITSIKTEGDTIIVKRSIIYKRFHNSLPYPEETIVIDRNNMKKPSDIILHSFSDFGFKKE